MVRPKKKSKRISAAKRYKIEKKVKEHHRKKRKEARKSGKNKQKPKDPGIPNLLPFKEQLIQQLQERKQRAEEVKKHQKEHRRRALNRQRSLASLEQDAQRRARQFELQESLAKDDYEGGSLTAATKRAYYREFCRVVDMSDVVLEVLDCRDPLQYRCTQVEQAVLASPNKRLVLVLNKIDLIPRDMVLAWLKHLRNEFPTVAVKSSTQTQRDKIGHTKGSLMSASDKQLGGSTSLGTDGIMKLLSNYCRNAGIKTAITVGVVGFPNVGKSSLINSLKRSRICTVGATAGVTKTVQEIQLDKHIRLLDSPGVVLAKDMSDSSSALLNCVKLEQLTDVISPVASVLRRCHHQQVMERYEIPEFGDVYEFLAHLARRSGKLKKGGVPDQEAAARSVLKDWNSGNIKFFTHPPEQQSLPTHVSAEIVSSWGKEFDMASLEKDEHAMVEALPSSSDIAVSMETGCPVEQDVGDSESEQEMVCDEEDDSDSEDDDRMALSDEDKDATMTVVVPAARQKRQAVAVKSQKDPHKGLQLNKARQKEFKAQRQQKGVRVQERVDGDSYDFDVYFA